VLAWAHTNGSGVVVGGNSDIRDFKDLGGKRIAVPYWYTNQAELTWGAFSTRRRMVSVRRRAPPSSCQSQAAP
jgi:NitT/TauT family transport system substrate-binding protein